VRALPVKIAMLSALLIVLFISANVVASQKEHIITMRIEKLTFNYTEELYWNEKQFNQEYKRFCKNFFS